MRAEQIVLLLVAALAAGWVDAVVGGGGLLQLPVLLLAGLSPVEALATNKTASIFGTASAAVTFARKTKIDRAVAVPAGILAVCFAGAGAASAALLAAEVLKPLVMVVLLAVAAFVTLRRRICGCAPGRGWRRRSWRAGGSSPSTTASSGRVRARSC
jgi:hypothetical protein